MGSLDPLLLRQLKKSGGGNPDTAPSLEVWREFLQRVSDHYRHMRDDRDMLVRSLELSTQEMESYPSKVKEERSLLSDLIGSLGETLGALASTSEGEVAGAVDAASLTSRLEGTEVAFLGRLDEAARSLGAEAHEVALVRRNFSSLARVLRDAVGERASRQSLQRELEVARAVQQLLLPTQSDLSRPFLDLVAHTSPAAECSGDWWTVHDLPDGRVLLVVGDVTGHGVPAAILTGAAKASCDIARALYDEKLSPSNLLKVMNRGIEGAGGQRMLMTCVAAIFDPHTRQLSIANAGHALPYLVRLEQERPQVSQLRAHGTPLGTSREASYTAVRFDLQEGDLLFFYTDGLLEREGPGGDTFGHKRLRLALEQGATFDPKGLRDVILHQLARHAEKTPAADDLTFIACRYGEV